MAITLSDGLLSMREYLGYPSYDVLTLPMCVNAYQGRLTYFANKLNLVNQNWRTGYAYLTVDTNNNEYLVPEGVAGPIIRPTKVEFYDDTYPNRNGPEIPIVHLQDSDLVKERNEWWFYDLIGISIETDIYDGAYIAAGIAFYGSPMKCRIIPRPLQTVTYKIWGDTMPSSVPVLGAAPDFQQQFLDLVAVASARLVLPSCNYPMDKYQQYADTLDAERARLEQVFDVFMRSSKHPDTRRRRPYRPGGVF